MKTFMRFIIKDGERHFINKLGVFNHEINDKYLHIEDKFFEEFLILFTMKFLFILMNKKLSI